MLSDSPYRNFQISIFSFINHVVGIIFGSVEKELYLAYLKLKGKCLENRELFFDETLMEMPTENILKYSF